MALIGIAIDIAEGRPPAAPQGVTRIARMNGILVQSTDGADYKPITATMRTKFPTSRAPGNVGIAIDIAETPVAPSRRGVTRIGRIGGLLVQSIDGGDFVSLRSIIAPLILAPVPDGPFGIAIDIGEGAPPPGAPGTTRIARIGGVLMASIDGGDYTPLAPLVPPGTPLLYFDAGNIDGANNATLVDGQAVATWKNLGSKTGSDLVQAMLAQQPVFRKVAAAGKINDEPALDVAGAAFMSTANATASPQPLVFAVVFLTRSTADQDFVSGATGTQPVLEASAGDLYFRAAALPTKLPFGAVTGEWCADVIAINGAASSAQANGGPLVGPVNAGPNGITTLEAFGDLDGLIAMILVYQGGGAPSFADIAEFFMARYGATPS